MRGENHHFLQGCLYPEGTSPRARGKRCHHYLFPALSGNIPACAGKTGGFRGVPGSNQEHPRVRGENSGAGISGSWAIGTSPRARGKQRLIHAEPPKVRNIPACAGKTPAVQFPWHRAWEHPRVRGENTMVVSPCPASYGTSPRARGKHLPHRGHEPRYGNIPACAGKTSCCW